MTRFLLDTGIAAVALTLGNCAVVSKDSDLAAVPGLSVENWVGWDAWSKEKPSP